MKKLTLSVIALFALPQAFAQPSFDNLSKDDLENISKEFSANFAHRSAAGAAPLGDLFGFDVGVMVGSTATPEISKISEREGGEAIDNLYNAGLFAAISIPFGITAEAMILPEQTISDMSISNQSLALKWTFSKTFGIPIVDLAAKAHMSTTKMDYADTVDGVDTTIELDNSTTGFTLLASKSFFLIEPFIGFGQVTRDTSLSATGSAVIYDTAYSTNSEESVEGSSSQFLTGVQVNLGFVRIAGQYENVFDTSVTSLKMSFGF